MTAAASPAGELTAGDVARLRGISRKTAYRWLVQLEAKYGPRVVSRRGNRLVTTLSALEGLAPALETERTLDRIRDLEARYAEIERRLDGLARELSVRRAG